MAELLQSYLSGRWIGRKEGKQLLDASTGAVVATTATDPLDFEEALAWAKSRQASGILGIDFQARAAILRSLAKHLSEHKEAFYSLSYATGATKKDSWIDIDGGIGTLFAYASMGANELPSGNLIHEGPAVQLGKENRFAGSHVLVPKRGLAVHINAFNFPVWGMLEKFAPSFLAGQPCIFKPATATSYLTQAVVKEMLASGLLPEASLQLIIGGTGDLLDRLGPQDAVTFTGSADTAFMLRSHPNILRNGIPFNAEADSLNAALLCPDVSPEDEEFKLFVREVMREMTVKAGQKCTAIRRIIVPRPMAQAVAEALKTSLLKVTLGDPRAEATTMGPLASLDQQADVRAVIEELSKESDIIFGGQDHQSRIHSAAGSSAEKGAFLSPTLLFAKKSDATAKVHNLEAFGPVSSIIAYDQIDEAMSLLAYGRGSLVASIITKTPSMARTVVEASAAWHGRLHILDRVSAAESTGHGSPLPMLKHGGPGRAGGGEELGGIRTVSHNLQRTAVQGSPSMLTAATGEYVRGADVRESELHPFRRYFEDLQVGDSLLTHRRTVTEADIVNFGGVSGDYFYMHFDELAARNSQFGKRIAHGYFVLSAAAGLFVWHAEGPVLANYGLDSLRFVKPVAPGDTIQVRITCKRKIDKPKRKPDQPAQGVVAWDVQVMNQDAALVASYDILTLVAKKAQPAA